MKKTYIFGHRNPDTDSVTSAIALSYLKNKLGYNTQPVILSGINSESKFVLNYFNEKEPIFLNDVKIKVKDLNYTKNFSVVLEDSINDAYAKMQEAGISKIPVVDHNKHMLGIVTMKDIAREQFSDNIDLVKTTYDNILETIDGEEILRFDENINGNLVVASYRSTTFIDTVKLKEDSILMVGDRHSVIEYAVNSKVKMIILTGNHQIKEEHLDIACQNRINIIRTSSNTLIASRKINLANNISTVDFERNILSISEQDNITDFVNMANKTRYSYYPVVNAKDECTGILRVSDVTYDNKKDVILVDHNSYDQSAIGLEETNILEIVDHHNIGNIGTNMPINFRTMPVGSTNTIIYVMFKENNIEIPRKIAGLMLSGILSDTLILNSPTATEFDKKVVEELAEIAEVDYQKYGYEMLKAWAALENKTKEEIIYSDFKNYPAGDYKVGVSQFFTPTPDAIIKDLDEYIKLVNEISNANNYYLVCFLVTDILKNGSYVIYSDRAKEILEKIYKKTNIEEGFYVDGLVSRKKQIVPGILLELE